MTNVTNLRPPLPTRDPEKTLPPESTRIYLGLPGTDQTPDVFATRCKPPALPILWATGSVWRQPNDPGTLGEISLPVTNHSAAYHPSPAKGSPRPLQQRIRPFFNTKDAYRTSTLYGASRSLLGRVALISVPAFEFIALERQITIKVASSEQTGKPVVKFGLKIRAESN